MSTEPKWPLLAPEPWSRDQGQLNAYHAGIKDARAAWLAANDDPASSPVGEVRRLSVEDGNVAIRLPDGWIAGAPHMPRGAFGWFDHDFVKGWPVIGAVPGSPAAEAQQ